MGSSGGGSGGSGVTAGGVGNGSSTKRAATASTDGSSEMLSSAKKGRSATVQHCRREAERGAVKLALLDSEQVLCLSESDITMRGLQLNKVKAAIKKLELRLAPKNIESLVWDEDGEAETFGTTSKIQSMQLLMKKLTGLQSLVKAMSAQSNSVDASSMALKVAVLEATNAEVAIVSCVYSELLSREARQAWEDKEFAHFVETLSTGVSGCGKAHSDFAAVQKEVVLNLLKQYMKAFSDKDEDSKL